MRKLLLILVSVMLFSLVGNAQKRGYFKNYNWNDNGNCWLTIRCDGDVWWDSGKGAWCYEHMGDLVSGDFNGDGMTDLSCLYWYSDNRVAVFVFINQGNKLVQQKWLQEVDNRILYSRISNLRTGDFNSDGKKDLKFTYKYNDRFQDFILYSEGNKFSDLNKAN